MVIEVVDLHMAMYGEFAVEVYIYYYIENDRIQYEKAYEKNVKNG